MASLQAAVLQAALVVPARAEAQSRKWRPTLATSLTPGGLRSQGASVSGTQVAVANRRHVLSTRGVTSMAWAGALASVRLIVQGKHMELTDALKAYVEEKIGHAVTNHAQMVREVDVRVSARGGEGGKGQKLQRCEVTVYTNKHGVVRAEEEKDSMYASIDLVADLITRKLRKIKEKDGGHGRTWQMRNQPRVGELLADDVVDLAPIINKVADDTPDEFVRTKYFEMEPTAPSAALKEMLQLGHDFFAFRNADSGEINIVYKRKHGGYGIIVPRSEEAWEKKKGVQNGR